MIAERHQRPFHRERERERSVFLLIFLCNSGGSCGEWLETEKTKGVLFYGITESLSLSLSLSHTHITLMDRDPYINYLFFMFLSDSTFFFFFFFSGFS
jgi:hypothetical protein